MKLMTPEFASPDSNTPIAGLSLGLQCTRLLLTGRYTKGFDEGLLGIGVYF